MNSNNLKCSLPSLGVLVAPDGMVFTDRKRFLLHSRSCLKPVSVPSRFLRSLEQELRISEIVLEIRFDLASLTVHHHGDHWLQLSPHFSFAFADFSALSLRSCKVFVEMTASLLMLERAGLIESAEKVPLVPRVPDYVRRLVDRVRLAQLERQVDRGLIRKVNKHYELVAPQEPCL